MDSPSKFDGKKVGAPMDSVSASKAGVVRRNRSRRWNKVIEGKRKFGRLRADAADGVPEALEYMRFFALKLRYHRGFAPKTIARRFSVSTRVVEALLSTCSEEMIEKVKKAAGDKEARRKLSREMRRWSRERPGADKPV